MVEPPPLELFKTHLDVAPGPWFGGEHGAGAGLMLDLVIFEVFANLNNSRILKWWQGDISMFSPQCRCSGGV